MGLPERRATGRSAAMIRREIELLSKGLKGKEQLMMLKGCCQKLMIERALGTYPSKCNSIDSINKIQMSRHERLCPSQLAHEVPT